MKTILITGGSRGIGLAIAEKYLNTQEYNVVVTGRKEQTLEELSKEVDNKNFYTIAAKADDEEAADKTCKGKGFFFDASQLHSVNPFYTSDEFRITISGNFYLV